MLSVAPTGAILGATIHGVDVTRIDDREFARILLALGRYGVLRFPDQQLDIGRSAQFLRTLRRDPGAERAPRKMHAHVGMLSNLKEDGKYIGSPDAGQDWHTDMSYRDVMGFVNVLYGIRIPRRDGVPLGGTEFSNMHAVYDALPADIRTPSRRCDRDARLREILGAYAPRQGERASADDRRTAPPTAACGASAVPDASDHRPEGAVRAIPATRCASTNCPKRESDEMLDYLFDFQLEPRFRYTHTWTENDLLVWDHLGTIHRAIADYGPDEIRLMRRCQVMATKVFDPEFLRPVRELMAEAA